MLISQRMRRIAFCQGLLNGHRRGDAGRLSAEPPWTQRYGDSACLLDHRDLFLCKAAFWADEHKKSCRGRHLG
jgi:hypothetical protein